MMNQDSLVDFWVVLNLNLEKLENTFGDKPADANPAQVQIWAGSNKIRIYII